jgi:hypothetical protein
MSILCAPFHINWIPCHHGTARTQTADGGDGLQIWRVAANVLTCRGQSTMDGPPALGWGVGLTTPNRKK